MSRESKLPQSLLSHTPWPVNETPIWPASTFILRRNLHGKLFPEKLSKAELEEVKKAIKSALESASTLQNIKWIEAKDLNQKEREFLYEHFFTLEETLNFNEGQAFCLDDTNQVLITINFTDHLCLHFIDSNSDWKKCYERLYKLEKELNQKLNFASSKQFGFLTANPSLCGLGLTVESLLHLPLLLEKNAPQDLMKHLDNGVMLSSLQRNLDFTGHIAMLLNHYTLGVTEDQIIDLLHRNSITLMNIEKELQNKAKANLDLSIKDKISRAYGMLTSSCQMDVKEAFHAISYLKLGIQLGIVQGMDLTALHNLFFTCQRAHLLFEMPIKESSQKLLLQHRAEFLKAKLSNLILN